MIQKKVGGLDSLMEGIQVVQKRMNNLANFEGTGNFVIGMTGSGKSCFITQMIGGKLDYKLGIRYIRNHTQDSDNFPKIGNTLKSCTQIPEIYSKDGMTWIDPAGFLDTKGQIQEILNSYCCAKMFRKGNNARIILMVEFSSLQSARGGALVEAAKRLYQLFSNDFQKIIYSCILMVSKVNLNYCPTSEIIAQIRDIAYSNNNLSPEVKLLLRSIVDQNRILIYSTPDTLNSNMLFNMKQKISKVPHFMIINDANISISDQSIVQLQKFSNAVLKQINTFARIFEKQIEQNFLKQYLNTDQLEQNLFKLKESLTIMNNEQIAQGNFNSLQQLNQKLMVNKASVTNLIQLFKKIQFCQTLHTDMHNIHKFQEILLLTVRNCDAILKAQLQSLIKQQQKAKEAQRQASIQAEFRRFEEQRQKKRYKQELQKEKMINESFYRTQLKRIQNQYQTKIQEKDNEINKKRKIRSHIRRRPKPKPLYPRQLRIS